MLLADDGSIASVRFAGQGLIAADLYIDCTGFRAELLDRWRHRPPNEIDFDANIDIFGQSSWQYVLYGMGWKTDLSAKAGVFRLRDAAEAAFAEIDRQAQFAARQLPSNRELVRFAQHARFGPGADAA